MQKVMPEAGEILVITRIAPSDAWYSDRGELVGCRCNLTGDVAAIDDTGWLEGQAMLLNGPYCGKIIEFQAFAVAVEHMPMPDLCQIQEKDAWL